MPKLTPSGLLAPNEESPIVHGRVHDPLRGGDIIPGMPLFLGAATAQFPSASTSSTSYVTFNAITNVIVIKKHHDSRFLVEHSFSNYATGGALNGQTAILIGATDYPGVVWHHNNINVHAGWASIYIIDGLGAGTFTLIPRIKVSGNTINTDASDYENLVVWEIPPTAGV